jgi:hypothetical protein
MEKHKKEESNSGSKIMSKIRDKYKKKDPLMMWCDSTFYSWTKTL